MDHILCVTHVTASKREKRDGYGRFRAEETAFDIVFVEAGYAGRGGP